MLIFSKLINFYYLFGLCWFSVVEHGLSRVMTSGSFSVAEPAQGVWGLLSCSFRALEHRLRSCGTWAQLLGGMGSSQTRQ